MKIEAVDLFCGIGGLSYGLKQSGIQIQAGVDLDPKSQFPFEANNRAQFIHRSVTEVSGEEITQLYSSNSIRLLAGCAPCQPFSRYSQGPKGRSDDQWKLLGEFARLIRESGPELVTMENVPNLASHEVFKDFVSDLKNLGYHVSYRVVNCDEHGLPQTRKRLVLIASLLGYIEFKLPKNRTVTVREVLSDFAPLSAGDIDPVDPFHRSSRLSELNLKRIKASKPGGTWRDWPEYLRAECHKKRSGRTYTAVYARMSWDKPAPTITTQFHGFGNGRFGHPEQNRAITLREGAALQGFPKSYKFVEPGKPIAFDAVGRLVGNAVPPPLGRWIGETFRDHVSQLTSATLSF